MSADQDVNNSLNGTDPTGVALTWRWVRIRSRTVFGNLRKNQPFNWPNRTYAASTSLYDAVTGTAEQIAWRYIDSEGTVWDLKDFMVVFIENFIKTVPQADRAAAINKASQLRPWPSGFPGTPPYEAGQ